MCLSKRAGGISRDMSDNSTRVLIPAEELYRYRTARGQALELARRGQKDDGRRLLGRGLEGAMARRSQPWGPELVWLWVRALRHYDRRTP